jgi:tartrate-resistant acid phosphatase type 5
MKRYLRFAWIFLVLTACIAQGGPIQVEQPATQISGAAATLTPLQPQNQSAAASLTPLPLPTEPASTPVPTDTPTAASTATATEVPKIVFGVIGDYGSGQKPEGDVASLVKSWNPDIIITVGDNNYPWGEAASIDQNVGQYYQEFIGSYKGQYGPGSAQNRFFPTLGNHDWVTDNASAYFDYFTLPGNERYYDFTWGPVHFFAVDSDSNEPDGFRADSVQAAWLQAALAAATEPWKVVFFHHAPYSSGMHQSTVWMRWPFQAWGASVVLSGHDHTYERVLVNDFPYFVNGLGGGAVYNFEEIIEGSQARYNNGYGAMRVEADPSSMKFEFFTATGELVDSYILTK